MDTSCVKQSNKLKYVAYVLGEVVPKKYRQQPYYDTPKYVVHVMEGATSNTYMRLPESRNHQHVITTFAGSSCHRGGSLKLLFRGLITVRRQL